MRERKKIVQRSARLYFGGGYASFSHENRFFQYNHNISLTEDDGYECLF